MRLQLVRRTAAIVVLALLVINVGFWLVLGQRAQHDVGVVLDSRVRSALALVVIDNGHLGMEETPADETIEAGFWLFAPGGNAVVEPVASPVLTSDVRRLVTRGPGDTTSGDLRLRAADAEISGHVVGTIVVGVSLAGFTASQHASLLAAVILDVLILAGTVTLTSRTVASALHPVHDMTVAASDWSQHSLERRFTVPAEKDEISDLAVTLNSLLGRISGLLRHEQAVTSGIAHELKTPLTRMASSAEVALSFGTPEEQRGALHEVIADSYRLAELVDELLAASTRGGEGVARCDLVAVARAQVEAVPASADIRVELVTSDAPVWAECSHALATRALAPLIANAIKHARSAVTVQVVHAGQHVAISVIDDGAGFHGDELEQVFLAGYRGATCAGPGHGLGLSLARRLARSSAGDVTAQPGPDGRIQLTLPAGWSLSTGG